MKNPEAHTPVMRQYLAAKAQAPNMLLLFRMGDFYEFFYDDALKASKILNITLTQRGESAGSPIVMAGVPAHSLDQYLARLVKAGESAALCEQVGEVGKDKGPVRREITRVVTPGTITEDALLDASRQNLVASILGLHQRWGLAWLELSSGRFSVLECDRLEQAQMELKRLQPSEVLCAEDAGLELDVGHVQKRPPWHFDVSAGQRLLSQQMGSKDLRGFGCQDLNAAIGAAGALLQYIKETQKCAPPHLQGLRTETLGDFLLLDPVSRRNLEIDSSNSGDGRQCLVSVLDSCRTSMGRRGLRRWLTQPLRLRPLLDQRLDATQELLAQGRYEKIRKAISELADLERILSRVALRNARPRDLAGLMVGLEKIPAVVEVLGSCKAGLLGGLRAQLGHHAELAQTLRTALADDLPVLAKDGNVFRPGYDAELDRLRALSRDADEFMLTLERQERARTGIETLKVGYNRIHGFYIEVGKSHAARIPLHYSRRQTLTNFERYITDELKAFEDQVLSARDEALRRELALYEDLFDLLLQQLRPLQLSAQALTDIDVLACFAERAVTLNLSRPELVEAPVLDIRGGRHLVVEAQAREPFVANDLSLDPKTRLLVITGPNMGGKSTYMRQIALIVLMAHAGCHVPAEQARLGPVDRIFTRIGASDDLASGQSTFMVEMTETANILNNATGHSLILMDEIGRGTSTYDGLALARACAEDLATRVGAYTLFATHYFELTDLENQYGMVANVHLDATEHGDKLVLLHRVKAGPANRSFGLKVAALAGVPAPVVEKAGHYLRRLESEKTALPDVGQRPAPIAARHPAVELLSQTHPDSLSPKQALDLVYRLVASSKNDKDGKP